MVVDEKLCIAVHVRPCVVYTYVPYINNQAGRVWYIHMCRTLITKQAVCGVYICAVH